MSQVSNLQRPIITGTPQTPKPVAPTKMGKIAPSFGDLLKKSITQTAERTEPIEFSKHAIQRAEQRGISFSEDHFERLGRAMSLASDKGLNQTLVMMDQTALIVSVPNRIVITVVDEAQKESAVFTNIDGAVIV